MSKYEVVVVGLGAMGSAALYHLAARNRRVLGLEQFAVVHDQGSSHGESRGIRRLYFRGAEYVKLVNRAYELWDSLAVEAGQTLLLKTGGILIGTKESKVISGGLRAAREHGLPHEYLTAQMVRDRYPQFVVDDNEVAIYEEGSGVVVPERCIEAHVWCAKRRGAEVHTGERMIGWEITAGDNVVVQTDKGRYQAARLVLTLGPWSNLLTMGVSLPLSVERQVMYWFEPLRNASSFDFGHCPSFTRETAEGRIHYGFPRLDGRTVKVAITHEGEITTPDTIRRTVDESEIAEIRSRLQRTIPDLNGQLVKCKTCMYTDTPDENFVIGLHPSFQQVVLAAGFSGHGFKFSAVVGEILADLAAAGTTDHPIGMFAPQRFL